MYSPFDIVWAKLFWLNCWDERPWLLIDVRKGGESYGAFPISGEFYRSGGSYMILPMDHKDFSATGLQKRSSLFYESTFDAGSDEIRKRIGQLTGELLENLKLEAGLDD